MNRAEQTVWRGTARSRIRMAERSAAFTLIELLVVISIIGLLAALVVPLAGIATTKMRLSRTKAELNNLVTAIETYKLQVGEYPPDNGRLKNLSALVDEFAYKSNAAMNPLFYELLGAVFTNKPSPRYFTVSREETITPTELNTYFGVSGLRNAARSRSDLEYKGFSLKESQYEEIQAGDDIEILKAPVPGTFTLKGNKGEITPWFYDASSTNRHNRNGFDLWAEIKNGKETNIVGNWKQ